MHEPAYSVPAEDETGRTGGEAERGRRSVLGQVALHLPFAHAADVFLPFLTLGFDEPLVDVRAERLPDDVVLLEHVERLVKVARQLVDTVLPALAKAHCEDVLIQGGGRGSLLLYPVEPRGEV